MVKKLKKKPFIIFFVSVLTFLSALFLSTNVAYADGKELTGVVTDKMCIRDRSLTTM